MTRKLFDVATFSIQTASCTFISNVYHLIYVYIIRLDVVRKFDLNFGIAINSQLKFFYSSINSYSSNSGDFKFTSLLSAIGVFVGVFGGSFVIGTLMALVTSLVSLIFMWT